MFPILVGMVVGVVIYWVMPTLWKPLPQVFAGLFAVETANPAWRQAALFLRILAWAILILVGVVFLPASVGLLTEGKYVSSLQGLYYNTRLMSGLLGASVGVLAASWYRDARAKASENLALRGIAVGGFAIAVIVYGANNDNPFIGRVTKLSTSVVSIELDRDRKKDSSPLTATAPSIQSRWTATARIGLAMDILKDLSEEGIMRDDETAHFLTNARLPALPSAVMLQSYEFARSQVGPIVQLRRRLHEAKRDANPIFFDTEYWEEARLAIKARNFLLGELSNGFEKDREAELDGLASFYAEFVVRSHEAACVVNATKGLEPGQYRCNFMAESQMAREQAIAEMRKQISAEFVAAYPKRDSVIEAPYVAIFVACLFYASGETEAAVALLDRWLRHGRERNAPNPRVVPATPRERTLARIQRIRVNNLIGTLLADEANAVHLELSTNYQRLALDETDKLISEVAAMDEYAASRKFRKGWDFDVIASASLHPSDERGRCEEPARLGVGARYFVFRRWNLLNNIVYYLAKQPHLLDRPDVAARFQELIQDLRYVRIDCLTMDVAPDDTPAARRMARADNLSRTLDTLAKAMVALARLRGDAEADGRQALCDAHRAATLNVVHSEQAIDTSDASRETARRRREDPHLHEFARLSLAENGQRIFVSQPLIDAKRQLRDLQDKIERLGEGACGPGAVASKG